MLASYDDSSEEARVKNQQSCITTENLAAIQVKHQIEVEHKQKNQEYLEKQENIKQIGLLGNLADKIHIMIQFQQGSNLQLKSLIEKMLNDVQKGTFLSRGK